MKVSLYLPSCRTQLRRSRLKVPSKRALSLAISRYLPRRIYLPFRKGTILVDPLHGRIRNPSPLLRMNLMFYAPVPSPRNALLRPSTLLRPVRTSLLRH